MGIRSPRLLKMLARRIAVALVVALAFVPSAFAGTGPLPPLPLDSLAAPVDTSQLPSLPAAVEVPTPTVAAPQPLHVTIPAGPNSSSSAPKLPEAPASVIAARQKQVHVLSSNTRDAPAQRETHATPVRQLTTPPASTTAGRAPRTLKASLLPLPTPWGIAGASSGVSPSAIAFVLLVLAAALAALAAPGLGRRVHLFVRAPRPHCCLLAIERPD